VLHIGGQRGQRGGAHSPSQVTHHHHQSPSPTRIVHHHQAHDSSMYDSSIQPTSVVHHHQPPAPPVYQPPQETHVYHNSDGTVHTTTVAAGAAGFGAAQPGACAHTVDAVDTVDISPSPLSSSLHPFDTAITACPPPARPQNTTFVRPYLDYIRKRSLVCVFLFLLGRSKDKLAKNGPSPKPRAVVPRPWQRCVAGHYPAAFGVAGGAGFGPSATLNVSPTTWSAASSSPGKVQVTAGRSGRRSHRAGRAGSQTTASARRIKNEVFDQLDDDGNEVIDREEWNEKLSGSRRAKNAAFDALDADGNGVIDRSEWRKGVKASGGTVKGGKKLCTLHAASDKVPTGGAKGRWKHTSWTP